MMLRFALTLVAAGCLVTHLGCAFSGRYCDTTCPMSGRFYEGESCDAPGCDPCGRGNGWFTRYHTHCQGCGDMYWGEAFGPRCDSCDDCGNFTGGPCCRSPWEFLADVWTLFWDCGCQPCYGCGGCESCGGFDGPYASGGCAACGHDAGHVHGATIRGGVMDPPPAYPTEQPEGAAMRQSVLRPTAARPVSTGRYSGQQMSYQQPTARKVQNAGNNSSHRIATAASMPAPPRKGQQAAATSTPRMAALPAGAVKSTGSRVPMTAEDFDLPPGARIIRIEEGQ